MSAITIAALVEAVAGIATIGSHVIDLIDKIPPRRKVREGDIEPLRTRVDQLVKAQDELKNSLGALANTLGAYIRAYFDLEPIADACELLQVYIEDNEDNFTKKSVARYVWENVGTRLGAIQKKARDKYKTASINHSDLVDLNDLTKIELRIGRFDKASTQAKVHIDSKALDDLRGCVRTMVEESQEISNVLKHRIGIILGRPVDLQ